MRGGLMRPCDLIEDLARNSSRSQREPRDKGDAIALAIIHHVIPLAIGKAVTVLNGNDRNDPAGTLNMLLGHIRQCDEPDFSLALELRQRSHRILERNDWIRAVQLIDVNALQAEPF